MNRSYIRFRGFLFLLMFLLSTGSLLAQVKLCSWNIRDFGKSKSDVEMEAIAEVLRDFDLVALQEVVAGYGGAQAVARLADELNRKGAAWDYVISDPTTSSPYGTERYAYLWKPAKVKKIDEAWLEGKYEPLIDREPYYLEFSYAGASFTLVNFHAVPKSKQPETEIKYFKFLPALYPGRNLLFLGDFNVPQSHTVFNPLKKMNYRPALIGQKTSLKTKCNGGCLASEVDNIFYHSGKIEMIGSGVLHFYENFADLKEARQLSDHVPVWMEFDLCESEEPKT